MSEAISSMEGINVRGSKRSLFFPVMATIMAAIVFVAFSRTFYFRVITGVEGNVGNGPLPVQAIVHGLFASLWTLVFLVQPWLVAARRVRLHRSIGYVGVATAVALVVSGAIVTLYFVPRAVGFSIPLFPTIPVRPIAGTFFGNFLSLLAFTVFVTLAVRRRQQPEMHKRMMFFATLSIIGPAFAANQRPVGAFLQQFLPQIADPGIAFVLGSAIALVVYDFRRLRSAHAATLIGIGILTINYGLTFYLANHEGAQNFVLSFA